MKFKDDDNFVNSPVDFGKGPLSHLWLCSLVQLEILFSDEEDLSSRRHPFQLLFSPTYFFALQCNALDNSFLRGRSLSTEVQFGGGRGEGNDV